MVDIKKIKLSVSKPDAIYFAELSPEDFLPLSTNDAVKKVLTPENTSYWRGVWKRFQTKKPALAALAVLLFIMLFAFVGPLLVPYGYDEFNAGAENLYPWHYSLEDQKKLDSIFGSFDERLDYAIEKATAEKGSELSGIERAKIKAEISNSKTGLEEIKKENNIHEKFFGYSKAELERKAAGESVFPHVFGTDKYGRDIMVRVMIGTRVSILVGFFAALLVMVIGTLYGAVSGFLGGRADTVMMRIVELIYALPDMLVVLLLSTVLKPELDAYQNGGSGFLHFLVGLLGSNIISMFIAFGLMYWVTSARIVRGQILKLKNQEFVTAAKALGASSYRIIFKHLLPNCAGQIIVTACLEIPIAVFLESFLSYLGVGVSAPMTSLGSMASDALSGVSSYGYRLIIPAVLLSLIILSFNITGDCLRDALDQRIKK